MTQQRVSPISVTSTLPAVPVLSLQAALGQTADLQQWQNNSGTVLVAIAPSGTTYALRGSFIGTGATTTKGLIIQGAASQTANLQEWQNSAGTVLTKIDSAGKIISDANMIVTYSYLTYLMVGQGESFVSGTSSFFRTINSTTIGIIVRGVASQTANLQEWQDSSGTVLSSFDQFGRLRVRSTTTSAFSAAIEAASAATVGLLVKGAASQTANLQEWQDSAGTILSFVDSIGRGKFVTGLFGTLGSSIGSNVAVATNATTTIGLIVRGAASQTANLQEWQNSAGTVLAYVAASGTARFDIVQAAGATIDARSTAGGGVVTFQKATSAPGHFGTDYARLYFRDGTNAGTLKLVVRAGSAGAETTILDNIPQT